MNTLAFDTCFGGCSVAVAWGDRPDGAASAGVSRFAHLERGHAERLMPMIADAMADAPFALADVQRIVVTTGPGTFTGQRVGIAAARALALASGAEVVTLSSLAVMAHTARAELGGDRRSAVLAIAVDARRGEIYFQAFDGVSLAALGEPALTTPDDAAALLAGRGSAVVAGSGAEAVAAAGRARGVDIAASLPALQPDMRHVPLAALRSDGVPPKPLYLRPPDAKPQDGKQLARAP